MRLKVKRAHSPYPGVRLAHGFKMVIEPDEIAEALIRRGWFDPDTDESAAGAIKTKTEAEVEEEEKEKEKEEVPKLRRSRKPPS